MQRAALILSAVLAQLLVGQATRRPLNHRGLSVFHPSQTALGAFQGQSYSISRSRVWQPDENGKMRQVEKEVRQRSVTDGNGQRTGSVFTEWEDGKRKSYRVEGDPEVAEFEERPLLRSNYQRSLVPELMSFDMDPFARMDSVLDMDPFARMDSMLDPGFPRMGSLMRSFDRAFAPLHDALPIATAAAPAKPEEKAEPGAQARGIIESSLGSKSPETALEQPAATPAEAEDRGIIESSFASSPETALEQPATAPAKPEEEADHEVIDLDKEATKVDVASKGAGEVAGKTRAAVAKGAQSSQEPFQSVTKSMEVKMVDGKWQGKEVVTTCENGECKTVERELEPEVMKAMIGGDVQQAKIEGAGEADIGDKAKPSGAEAGEAKPSTEEKA